MQAPSSQWKRNVGSVALLLALALGSYIPAIGGGFIWDDDSYIQQNMQLRSMTGLKQIWTDPKATPQYYPLVHTSFWIEYHLWGLTPAGYHVVNVLLHVCTSVLLWRVLTYLHLRGALLAAAIFAIHPVHVESVAWATERKNVLSGLFYMLSAMAYLRFALPAADPQALGPTGPQGEDTQQERGAWKFYFLAVFLFGCSLLSKTVTATLPAAILLVLWWKKPRLHWRDFWPLAPMFVIGAFMGLLTARLEVQHVGASGREWDFTILDRLLIAGHNLWFYIGKLLWPYQLTFVYPRWKIDAHDPVQYLYPLAFVAMLAALFVGRRRIGKGPLVAMLFFAVTLFPALGFVNVYPFRFSFVADHFQYLGSLGVIVLLAAMICRLPAALSIPVKAAVLAALCAATFAQGYMYKDLEHLWRETIARNPEAWLAHNNLGGILMARAIANNDHVAYEEAVKHFRAAIGAYSDDANAHFNFGLALERTSRHDEAMEQYKQALAIQPANVGAHVQMGFALERLSQDDAAREHFQQALQADPRANAAYAGMGQLCILHRDLDGALGWYKKAVDVMPDVGEAWYNLGVVYTLAGDVPNAVKAYRQAVKLQRQYVHAATKLAWLLVTDENPEIRNADEAMPLAEMAVDVSHQRLPEAMIAYAAAYAEKGDFTRALVWADKAMNVAQERQQEEMADRIYLATESFNRNQPYREAHKRPATRPASEPASQP